MSAATRKPGPPRPQRSENCPCCGYHYGNYWPRHCPDSNPRCGWWQCRECSAIVPATGKTHISHKVHACGATSVWADPDHPEQADDEEAEHG